MFLVLANVVNRCENRSWEFAEYTKKELIRNSNTEIPNSNPETSETTQKIRIII